MKVVAELAAEAWDEIGPATLRKSWQKILAITDPNEESTNVDDDETTLSDFTEIFDVMRSEISEQETTSWLENDNTDPKFQVFTENEICEIAIQEESEEQQEGEEDTEEVCPISNATAAHMFEQCLRWSEHQPEANTYNTSMLWELESLAARKRWRSFKQTSIEKYFCRSNTQ